MNNIIVAFLILMTTVFSYGQVWKEFLFTEEIEEKYVEQSDTSKIDTIIVPHWQTFQQEPTITPNFSIPHKRFISYPAFLMVFPKNDFTDNSLPIAIKEIRTKEDKTSFYLSKGEYIFLFLYRDREVYHTLNVNITK